MKLACFGVLVIASAMLPRPAQSQTAEELAEQVRSAETAFARTMADRDLEAFAWMETKISAP